jgi:hypothetical protein
MSVKAFEATLVKRHGDVILFQRISGGWEYRYTSQGDSYQAFAYDPVQAKARLKHQLSWDRQRFERADFRRF